MQSDCRSKVLSLSNVSSSPRVLVLSRKIATASYVQRLTFHIRGILASVVSLQLLHHLAVV
jgi:hypothetical protein